MRLPPNRLFPWLPLLLFAASAPALAAQSWTTVWTPGGAPSTQTAVQGGDHDSKTNCYPCKEWEEYPDGGGKWVKYPTNTPPQICPGDTTNYICKMCDGMGIVTNRPNNTPVDAGKGCGCCKDGKPWAPDEDCPNPPILELDLTNIGGCPYCEKAIMGCQGPANITPAFIGGTCFKACEWKPGSGTITVYFYEGRCLEKCNANINSADDVNINNYCDVLKMLKAEIKQAEDWLDDPPIGSVVGDWDGSVDAFCFGDCISRHEAHHTQQMREMLLKEGAALLDELMKISVPFNCGDAKTAEGAADFMKNEVNKLIKDQYDDFLEKWHNDDDLAKKQEQEAHQISLQCMQNLLQQIEDKIATNGWKACN